MAQNWMIHGKWAFFSLNQSALAIRVNSKGNRETLD
jgi:hypothetical protein